MPATPLRNHFLDALRGIAALLVLATHLQSSLIGFYPSGWLALHPVAAAVLEHGAIGVDVFFLISGFIVFLAARRVVQAGRGVRLFLRKRFLRIFLPYWPLALVLGASYALFPGLSASVDPIKVNWLKTLTLIPGGGDYSLPVARTLSFELFFYLLLGLSLILPRPRWRWGLIAAPSLAALLFTAAGASVDFGQATNFITLLASPYQWEFLLGSCVAVLAGHRSRRIAVLRRQVLLQAGLLALAAVLLLVPLPLTVAYRAVLLLALAALILFSAERDYQRPPGLRAIAWLGTVSYSLYLLHNPVQSLVIRLAVRLGLPEFSAALLLAIVPILTAWAYFATVESWSLWVMQKATAPRGGSSSSQSA
jgi:hypothetical protein